MDNIPYIYEHIQDIILKHLINSYITNKSLKYYKYRNVCKLWMNHIDNEQYLAYSDNHSVNNKNRKLLIPHIHNSSLDIKNSVN